MSKAFGFAIASSLALQERGWERGQRGGCRVKGEGVRGKGEERVMGREEGKGEGEGREEGWGMEGGK